MAQKKEGDALFFYCGMMMFLIPLLLQLQRHPLADTA